LWSGVILQGRADDEEWFQSVKITYTIDGHIWQHVEGGKVFTANKDMHNHQKIIFDACVCFDHQNLPSDMVRENINEI
jgi:hypothetical protein